MLLSNSAIDHFTRRTSPNVKGTTRLDDSDRGQLQLSFWMARGISMTSFGLPVSSVVESSSKPLEGDENGGRGEVEETGGGGRADVDAGWQGRKELLEDVCKPRS